jgi:hypothetical protein
LVIAERWNRPNCPSPDKQNVEYCLAMKRNEIPMPVTTGEKLEYIM